MKNISSRQQQVLDYLIASIKEKGYPPTLREIARHIGTQGTVTAIHHLDALEKKGFIRREAGSSRGIHLLRKSKVEFVPVPIVGVVRAGMPTLAVEEIEGYYPVDKMQLKGGAFFLRVKGDSMINDAIMEGDLALIRPQKTAINGDIVVALIDGEATLKRFYREKDHIRLQPRNPNMEPIIIPANEEITLIGKAIRIIRDID